MPRRRPGPGTVLFLLIGAHLALLWLLPLLPAQDLPQHMSYARILRDYQDEPAFRALYVLPERIQPYFVTYYAMAWLGRAMSIEVATRILLSAYVVGMMLSFQVLVSAAQQRARTRLGWSGLTASLIVWNPALLMGFLAFVLALPLVVLGSALSLRCALSGFRRASLFGLTGCALCAVSLHLVAAGCLCLFALVVVAVARTRRSALVAAIVLATTALGLALWQLFGEHGAGALPSIDWRSAERGALGLELITHALQLTWSAPPETLSYALWTAVAPYSWPEMAISAACALLLFAALCFGRSRSTSSAARSVKPAARAALIFAVLAWVAPWGMHVPSEVTFLNFRMLTVAFALALACVPEQLFASSTSRSAVSLYCGFALLQFGANARSFAREAQPALSLLREADPREPMLPLVFHHHSDVFAKQFRLTHFAPMYFTVRHSGLSAQFWARYTPHLPIGYRPGRALRGPPDWEPWKLRQRHLRQYGYVLIERARDDDPEQARRASNAATKLLSARARRIRCAGDWCLYRTPQQPPP